MSKRAEDAALKAYPVHDGASEQWKKAHLSGLTEYIQGYEQAEEDLALTWEDIAKIDSLIFETNNEFAVDHQKEISRRQFYEAVLQKYLHLNNRV